MRTTADIAAIVTLIVFTALVRRKALLLEREKRTSQMLYKANQRLMKELDDVLSER